MADLAVTVRITGRVQGVWFRGWTTREAKALALAGWVRNEADGSVSARFEGPREAVERMVALCRQGPPSARVNGVEVTPVGPSGLEEFTVERS